MSIDDLELNIIGYENQNMKEKTCIVCNSKENKIIFRELDVDMLRCSNCGHVFSSYTASQDYDGYFGYDSVAWEESFWWGEAHERIYDDFCRRFIDKRGGCLLDVGCGMGYFVKKVLEFPSWQVVGCEISQAAVLFARERLGLNSISIGNVMDSGFEANRFDIITLWDVIEHIPDPDPILSCVNFLLKDDGFLFLHTPNIRFQLPKAKLKKLVRGSREDVHYLEAKDHVNIYSMKTITAVLGRNGFKNVDFIHLRPIQSVSGSRNWFLRGIKNAWFYSAVALFQISYKKINIDNLFIVAKKC